MGLTRLSLPDSVEARVVFIHGLGGSARKTWERSRSIPSWPEEISAQFPTVDVLTFGYRNPAIGRNVLSCVDTGQSLAAALAVEAGPRVPTVLVGHSRGGLVAKAAALAATEVHGSDLADTIAAVIFLGTPHLGANSLVSRAFWRFGSRAVRELRPNSTELEDLDHRFAEWWRRRPNVKVVNLLESELTMAMLLVVDAVSYTHLTLPTKA